MTTPLGCWLISDKFSTRVSTLVRLCFTAFTEVFIEQCAIDFTVLFERYDGIINWCQDLSSIVRLTEKLALASQQYTC
jgi:hypothetical protein